MPYVPRGVAAERNYEVEIFVGATSYGRWFVSAPTERRAQTRAMMTMLDRVPDFPSGSSVSYITREVSS